MIARGGQLMSAATLAVVTLAGCGILSGLDDLNVTDASVDASDAAVDVAAESGPFDAKAADQGSTACPYDGSVAACFGEVCVASSACCVHASSFECASSCTGIALKCSSPATCGMTTPLCCLQGVTRPSGTSCPLQIGVVTATASCVSNGQCIVASPSNVRLCGSDLDCTPPTTCKQAQLGSLPTTILGVCE